MTKYQKFVSLSIVSMILTLFLIYKITDNEWKEKFSPYILSNSISESIQERRFIDSVLVIPNNIIVDSIQFEISESWVQQAYKISFKYIFFKEKQYLQRYFLCYRMNILDSSEIIKCEIKFIVDDIERFWGITSSQDVYSYSIDSLHCDSLNSIVWINGNPTDDTINFVLSEKIITKFYER